LTRQFSGSAFADAKQLLDLVPAFVRDGDVAVLFVNYKIACELRGFAGRDIELFAFSSLGMIRLTL